MKAKSLFSVSKPKVAEPDADTKKIAELIKRRRRQILVHSCLYYELNQSIISDAQWSEWALELENLQKKYPDIAAKVEFSKEFKDFDHSTGANLRDAYNQPNIVSLAIRLLHDDMRV